MEQIILEVNEDVGKKWQSTPNQVKAELTKSIEKQIMNALDAQNSHSQKTLDKILEDSKALPGPPMSINEFKEWIKEAEKQETYSLTHAKKKWTKKRSQLEHLTP